MFSAFGGGGSKPSGNNASSAPAAAPAAAPAETATNSSTNTNISPTQLFDSQAFVRAAEAAKELDNSPHGRDAITLSLERERSRRAQFEAERADAMASLRDLEARRIQIEHEERRKTIEMETSHINHRQQTKDRAAHERQEREIAARKQLQQETLQMQEASIERQEQARRETAQMEQQMRRETEMSKIQHETQGRIEQERVNHDIRAAHARLRHEEERKTALLLTRERIALISDELSDFLSDPNRIRAAVVTTSLLFAGGFASYFGAKVLREYVMLRINAPVLVRETSRTNALKKPLVFARKLISKRPESSAVLRDMVLNQSEQARLESIVVSTMNAKRNNAPLRNLLLYGPPGTGKTMFAKSLAQKSGLEYALITGGDIVPLGTSGVTELHNLFNWAKTSRNGTLIFIDEAEAFLKKRDKSHISEELRASLNSFLYLTGEASDKHMVVLASNQPDHLDSAVHDRMDEMVPFLLPELDSRVKLVNQYFHKYIADYVSPKGQRIDHSAITKEHLERIARETEGFSGRSLSKLCISIQAKVLAQSAADGQLTLTPDMIDTILRDHEAQQGQRQTWRANK
ncbi:hypothetical protein H696_02312 [Fonticula alba]|uniref:AAA+ ATPase domain-containing protein n=1 Tax=Fonticula alba TaxID=691883 RepID=A0A058ZAH8_FONAL|nr:hypothetical protein H696_02312 [Fonticula alba]KCV71360.1 hypothetical protein H696_02312 [Fonticula alba]|eukprot:XP_009494483.1 hypothetical protein H696_02312 [Fonticula alba]